MRDLRSDDTAETLTSGDATKPSALPAQLRWVLWRRPSLGALAGAVVAFCLSLTPSLLPREALLQGILTGVALAIGYALGAGVQSLVMGVGRWTPGPAVERAGRMALGVLVAVLVPLSIALGHVWQNDLRELMGMRNASPWGLLVMLPMAAGVAWVLVVAVRVFRGLARVLGRRLEQVLPDGAAAAVGAALTVVGILVVGATVLLASMGLVLQPLFESSNASTPEGISRPDGPARSGSPESQVSWESLGRDGKRFVATGPSAAEIAEFTGRPAVDPVRVYVGLESADTLESRVDLALAELDRTDAWSREVLAVFATTGTGLVDSKASDPLEYMHNGNTALVATQYSVLPSWLSFLVDQSAAAETSTALIEAIDRRLSQMAGSERPDLLVSGESLGTYGTESAFEDLDDMLRRTDGALLIGPVFHNHIHSALTRERDAGSPPWRPVYADGLNVRFAVAPDDLRRPDSPWELPRVAYLQNSSDPITYWNPDLLWSSPDWLTDPRGPDVSPTMRWLPLVSFLQVTADLAYSKGVPAGHGHVYGTNPVDGWAAVTRPAHWSQRDTDRLRRIMD